MRETAIAHASCPHHLPDPSDAPRAPAAPARHHLLPHPQPQQPQLLAVAYGHVLELPECISRLKGLRELSILGPGGDTDSPQPSLVAHPGAALPCALGALGGGLRALRVEGLVLPRRQLGEMTALERLSLAGWDAVSFDGAGRVCFTRNKRMLRRRGIKGIPGFGASGPQASLWGLCW